MIRMFIQAWIAFFVFNVLTTWWIMFASIPGMLVAVILNPVFMALPWVGMHAARRILPGHQGQASLILFWLSFELLHAQWDLSWSWLDLGNVFATTPMIIQWYEYTGTAGGTVWILISNLLLYSLIKRVSHQVKRKKIMILTGILAFTWILPIGISLNRWIHYQEPSDPVEVVVVQPAHNPYDNVEHLEDAKSRISYMVSLAEPYITPQTRFVVAPEGVNPIGIWMHEAENHFAVTQLRNHIKQHHGLAWVLGSFTYRKYESGESPPASAVPFANDNGYYDVYNSAIMVEEGQAVDYYHKSKLVPGIEQMPFHRFLRPIGKWVASFGGTQGSLGTQSYRGVFTSSENIAVAPLVCYESIYGSYTSGYIRNGASLLFIITNDGWWRNTPGHRQHFQYARLRAIETRRSIARAASTGISGFINQKGEVLQKSEWWEPAALKQTLHQNHEYSFYSRNGNFLGKLSLFLTLLLILYMITRKIIKAGSSH